MRTIHRSGILLAVTLSAGLAQAGGFATARFGGEHGTPVNTNPTAIYYNPAGIGEAKGLRIFVDGTLALRSASYETSALQDPADAPGANTGEAKLFNVVVAPMAGATYQIGDEGPVVGAAFFVPFGGISKWDTNADFEDHPKYPGPVDGVQRWYNIEGQIRHSYISAAVAYQIPGVRLSIGVAGNLILSNVHTIRARNTNGDEEIANAKGQPIEGRSMGDFKGIQGSFGIGALYQPIKDKLWLGASYQSMPNVTGDITLEGELTNTFNSLEATDASITWELPDVMRAGARFRPTEDIELRLFGDFTRWSVVTDHCIATPGKDCDIQQSGDNEGADNSGQSTQNLRRKWRNTIGVRAGGSYWVIPALEAFVGAGFDSSAVPDETLEPAIPDWNKITASLGAKYQFIDSLAGALSYTHVMYLSRDTSGKSQNSSYELPSRGPDSSGVYKQWIGVVNANVELSF